MQTVQESGIMGTSYPTRNPFTFILVELNLKWMREYIRENRGAPFVVTSLILLLVCAGLLVADNSVLANVVAIYAFYILVFGVVLQAASFLKYNRNDAENVEKSIHSKSKG
ncbi:MAG: hypothetical protein QG670_2055 [Thermoproteota archaeon]|nr:hypothetical protein [Thermoproteota archaeon]